MKTTLIGVAAWLLAVSTASADVQLTMQNGRVTLVAKDATVRQILAEWARVGHTKIVNLEAVPGGPITLELNNVTEAQALDVLLRSLSGYIAAPRAVEVANFSRLDRIIIMPTLAAARPAVSSPPPPVFQQTPQFLRGRGRRRRREARSERAGSGRPARTGVQYVSAAADRESAGPADGRSRALPVATARRPADARQSAVADAGCAVRRRGGARDGGAAAAGTVYVAGTVPFADRVSRPVSVADPPARRPIASGSR